MHIRFSERLPIRERVRRKALAVRRLQLYFAATLSVHLRLLAQAGLTDTVGCCQVDDVPTHTEQGDFESFSEQDCINFLRFSRAQDRPATIVDDAGRFRFLQNSNLFKR